MKKLTCAVFAAATAIAPAAMAQTTTASSSSSAKPADTLFGIRGYIQFRTAERMTGDEGFSLWSDRSVGDNRSSQRDNNFIIRRGRIIFSRQVSPYLGVYIQPDFGSSAGTTGNVFQLRDAYADVFVDGEAKVHRFRVGQSKVPFGWENMQSSSNRLGLDRADALNSAARDERDTGVFYYYTPAFAQQIYTDIDKKGLKHSGNYGMFGAGVYNGQGANRQDVNESLHKVVRFNWPGKTESGQYYEASVQAYSGRYLPTTAVYTNAAGTRNTVAPTVADPNGIKDERVALSAIYYPQPFGVQAEWNVGTSPGLQASTNRIQEQSISGGYVQAMLMTEIPGYGKLTPFVRYQHFDGFNKAETNAPENRVRDVELGVEWQFTPHIELTTVYHHMNRNNLVTGNRAATPDYAQFNTDYLRLQLQLNY